MHNFEIKLIYYIRLSENKIDLDKFEFSIPKLI